MNVWQRFTERARRVVFFAQEEAGRLGENYVSTEHLLLGLVREHDSVAVRLLERMGVSSERVRSEIEKQVAKGEGRMGQEMQLTPRAKRVIDLSYDEARQLGNNYIGTEHLLLGLVREGEGLAGKILFKLGVDIEKARRAVLQLHEETVDTKEDNRATPIKHSLFPPGDLGVLVLDDSHQGETKVELVASVDIFYELLDVYQAKDTFGYKELITTGLLFLLPPQTPVKVLVQSRQLRTQHCLLVRVLEGEHAGTKGWVAIPNFQHTGSDSSDFPPSL
jgi:hypothetical protein